MMQTLTVVPFLPLSLTQQNDKRCELKKEDGRLLRLTGWQFFYCENVPSSRHCSHRNMLPISYSHTKRQRLWTVKEHVFQDKQKGRQILFCRSVCSVFCCSVVTVSDYTICRRLICKAKQGRFPTPNGCAKRFPHIYIRQNVARNIPGQLFFLNIRV